MALKKKIVVVVVDVEFICSSNWEVRVGDQVERKLHPGAYTKSAPAPHLPHCHCES